MSIPTIILSTNVPNDIHMQLELDYRPGDQLDQLDLELCFPFMVTVVG